MLAKVAADESLPAKTRVNAEFGMAEFKKEVERLSDRLLQLDASVPLRSRARFAAATTLDSEFRCVQTQRK